jgi:hypothetical protein
MIETHRAPVDQISGACFSLPATTSNLPTLVRPWWKDEVASANLPIDVRSAMANLLPGLVCGEESAVQVFHQETRRVRAKDLEAIQLGFVRIEAEERRHHEMLQWLRAELPPALDLVGTRNRARRFFINVQSRDLATHFSRIVELDSAVCRIMHRLACSQKLAASQTVVTILRRIQKEEAGHVRLSREYAKCLGVTPSIVAESRNLVRSDLVSFLESMGGAFEALGVDPDRLFRSIRNSGVNELPHP